MEAAQPFLWMASIFKKFPTKKCGLLFNHLYVILKFSRECVEERGVDCMSLGSQEPNIGKGSTPTGAGRTWVMTFVAGRTGPLQGMARGFDADENYGLDPQCKKPPGHGKDH